jgi:5-methylcytosine-specific restriction endonuclease McrA
MKNKKINLGQVWKQVEDVLVPRLRLSVTERAIYYHLLRHSRLEGKVRMRFSIASLGRGMRLSDGPVREAVRRLVDVGALRLVRRSKTGHLVEVRVPGEIRAARLRNGQVRHDGQARLPRAASLEEIDFMQTRALRKAIHARESGQCFYCLRRLTCAMQGLDHVVPRAQSGCSSYRNLVSCCLECNSQKGETPAGDFLRWLYREGRLTPAELTNRLRALEALSAGKLRPSVQEKEVRK